MYQIIVVYTNNSIKTMTEYRHPSSLITHQAPPGVSTCHHWRDDLYSIYVDVDVDIDNRYRYRYRFKYRYMCRYRCRFRHRQWQNRAIHIADMSHTHKLVSSSRQAARAMRKQNHSFTSALSHEHNHWSISGCTNMTRSTHLLMEVALHSHLSRTVHVSI